MKPQAHTNISRSRRWFLSLLGVFILSPSMYAGPFTNGVNLQPSYYNNGNVNFGWSLMKANSKIQCVRIEIEPDKVSQAKSWIAQAASQGYTVIATYHKASVLGSDSTTELDSAGGWWKLYYSTLRSSGSFYVNLMNEWGSHNISANSYASAVNHAMSYLRAVYSGLTVVDIPGWGQETATAAAALKGTYGTKISDTKIVPSVHVYPSAWVQSKGHVLQNSDLDDLASAGRGGMVGEFGWAPSGGANWQGITDYAHWTKGWTVIGWAWNGDGSYGMNMVSPSWSQNSGATSFSKSSYFDQIYNHL